jgi:hypothetical protein
MIVWIEVGPKYRILRSICDSAGSTRIELSTFSHFGFGPKSV